MERNQFKDLLEENSYDMKTKLIFRIKGFLFLGKCIDIDSSISKLNEETSD